MLFFRLTNCKEKFFLTFGVNFDIIMVYIHRKGGKKAVKVKSMITNKEYFERWEHFLVEYCHCYADDNGNRPCDNGAVCCYCDSVVGIFWDEILKIINEK